MSALFADVDQAVADIPDGATILIGGFDCAGQADCAPAGSAASGRRPS
jgi:hypothetical protein